VGRHLRLACDNCVPGDASGWYLPLAFGVVAAFALAFGCLLLAGRRERWGRALALVAAGCLAAGPAAAVFVLAAPVTYDGGRVTCGSALSASLERGLPDDSALDEYQAGCKARGERWRGVAAVLGIGSVVVAGVCAAGAALPDGRREPLPAMP
jgi:peptidoglycan/LPS O-acetylase OafA/YrhL